MREAPLRAERRQEHDSLRYPVRVVSVPATVELSIVLPAIGTRSHLADGATGSALRGARDRRTRCAGLQSSRRPPLRGQPRVGHPCQRRRCSDRRLFALAWGLGASGLPLLMLVQAVAAPVPAILVAFASGLAFGVVWVDADGRGADFGRGGLLLDCSRARTRASRSTDELARTRDRRPLAYPFSARDHCLAWCRDLFRCCLLWGGLTGWGSLRFLGPRRLA